ncbi:MAG TPA: DUF805 domain-containing protein [Polyangiaceae bacterium]|nr:DUF805 domain-containing protein [Polyangiaceae bacterium]
MTDPINPYAAPTADWPEAVRRPRWRDILFSLEGRVPRRLYWATRALSIVPLVIAGILAVLLGEHRGIATLVLLLAWIACFWIALAGSVKRWHDLDKSGWWIFIALVPVIGGLWELIEAGCTRGTEGPNRYGRDRT